MKNILFIIILFPFVAFSQIGAKIGIGPSWMSNVTNQKPQFYMSGGLFYDIKISDLNLKIEALYSLRGTGFSQTYANMYDSVGHLISGGKVNYWYKFHYLEFPILLTKNIKSFFFNCGISPSFIVASKIENQVQNSQTRDYLFYDLKCRTFSLPIIFSLGYKIKVSDKQIISIEARQLIGTFYTIDHKRTFNTILFAGINF